MLRLAEPLFSSRLGGWALIESPTQRNADSGQHWSLLIVATAAMVAMLAVVFDVRLGSGPDLSVGLPSSAIAEQAEVAAVEQRTVAPPSPTLSNAATSERAATSAVGEAQTTERNSASVAAEPTQGSEAAQTGVSRADTTEAAAVNADQPSDAVAEATASAVTVDDPASRIREYLGLHASAQLPVSFTYEVVAGDTASSVAQRFGLEEATVLFNNFDIYDPNHLSVGQLLKLPPVNGLVYTIQPGDFLDSLVENFQADLEATLAFPANGITSPDQIQAGQRILLVHGSASVASPVAATSSGGQATATWTEPTFIWPLGFEEVSDHFGSYRPNSFGYHTGVDFVAAVGTIVGSTAAGQVTVATWDPSYGNWVEIDHGGGFRSRYAHLNEIFVREGEWVQANTYIGTVGNTGNSSGAHLHFEIIVNGEAVNPLAWLN